MARSRLATYSLVACDLRAREWGVAVESKFPAAGAIVPWAEPEVGAIATQALANVGYGPHGLALLREGLPAEDVVARLTEADEERAHRQLGVVDAQGRAVTYTGESCLEWAGGVAGDGYAAQGNILVSEETVTALASTFEATRGRPLAERLLEALAAGQRAGGDRRGQQAAALLVVKRDSGYGASSDVLVDLRVDDHAAPIEELHRLYGIHELLFGETPEDEWLPVDAQLEGELRGRLGALGYAHESLEEAFTTWASVENLEERVRGAERIDPVVLAELRRRG
ncbi:MAG TPA: DUF1028 domain-containing protein [Gaiellaceae bacterium]|nr:DUF1028 domain-containing protein [Gaiellaceae bacterium]